MASHFFAYLSRLKLITRWGLMRSLQPENVQEHSQRVAVFAHALALLRNRRFGGAVNPERAALLALYHDAPEAVTGDLPTPVKHFSPALRAAYGEIETRAGESLLALLPDDLRDCYRPLIFADDGEREAWELVRAADKLCAWLKCVEERTGGNTEFLSAERTLKAQLDALDTVPEVAVFLAEFAPGFGLTLDQLGLADPGEA